MQIVGINRIMWTGFLAVVVVLGTPPIVGAQQQEAVRANADDVRQKPPEQARNVEEIVVTGSRIRTKPTEASAPILSISQEDIRRTGLTSVADILQRLPVSGGALNTRFNSSGNFGFPPDGGGIGAGAAQVDLRYLGSKRVLVLVDGIRWVHGASASGVSAATDLNTIPVSAIERVEVLEDGASAIYGSDAIAGVVNIVTKKDIDGFSSNVYFGGFQQGDGITEQYDLSWGDRTDRLSFTMNLSFVRQHQVAARDRAISRYPTAGVSQATSHWSSGTPQGRFVFTDPNTDTPVDVTLKPGVSGKPSYNASAPGNGSGDFSAFGTADRFNYARYNLVQTPSERVGFFSQLAYRLTSNTSLHVKALFNNRRSRNQAAPEPLFIGPEAGNGNRLDQISIDASNPYNPLGFTLDPAGKPYFIGRRPLEAGPRIYRQNVDTWYVSGGAQGVLSFWRHPLYWDATAAYSRNRADQVKNGGFNSAKLQKALGPYDACMAEPGCVPFNIFGGQGAGGNGTITPAMLEYVTFVQKDLSQQELFDLSANVTGDLFELPAGDIGVAAGVEYRRQRGFFQPDAVVVAGDTAGVPASAAAGGFDVTEAYAEMAVPILSDLPAINLLDVAGAVRLSQYSTFGRHQTVKATLRWRPADDLLVRTNYGQGFRAPAIGELYGTEARFDQTLNDPCSGVGDAAGPVQDSCAALGVPSDGSYTQYNPQISVTTGGNRDLKPERSQTYTASLVYSPSWFVNLGLGEALDLELTYYRIDLDDAIRAVDAQVQLDACVQTRDPVMCRGISRTATGVINGFSNQLSNIGGIETDGVDLTLHYLTRPTRAGRFSVYWLSSLLLNYDELIPDSTGFKTVRRDGKEVGDPEQAYPKLKSTVVLGWVRGDWSASLTSRYIHSVTESCRGLADVPGLCSDPNLEDDNRSKNVMAARFYNDVQVSWIPRGLLDDGLMMTVGVNNILNEEPPPCYSCALNGFDATTYDVPGVFGYVRAGYQM